MANSQTEAETLNPDDFGILFSTYDVLPAVDLPGSMDLPGGMDINVVNQASVNDAGGVSFYSYLNMNQPDVELANRTVITRFHNNRFAAVARAGGPASDYGFSSDDPIMFTSKPTIDNQGRVRVAASTTDYGESAYLQFELNGSVTRLLYSGQTIPGMSDPLSGLQVSSPSTDGQVMVRLISTSTENQLARVRPDGSIQSILNRFDVIPSGRVISVGNSLGLGQVLNSGEYAINLNVRSTHSDVGDTIHYGTATGLPDAVVHSGENGAPENLWSISVPAIGSDGTMATKAELNLGIRLVNGVRQLQLLDFVMVRRPNGEVDYLLTESADIGLLTGDNDYRGTLFSISGQRSDIVVAPDGTVYISDINHLLALLPDGGVEVVVDPTTQVDAGNGIHFIPHFAILANNTGGLSMNNNGEVAFHTSGAFVFPDGSSDIGHSAIIYAGNIPEPSSACAFVLMSMLLVRRRRSL